MRRIKIDALWTIPSFFIFRSFLGPASKVIAAWAFVTGGAFAPAPLIIILSKIYIYRKRSALEVSLSFQCRQCGSYVCNLCRLSFRTFFQKIYIIDTWLQFSWSSLFYQTFSSFDLALRILEFILAFLAAHFQNLIFELPLFSFWSIQQRNVFGSHHHFNE